MAENVQTGGVMQFRYSGGSQTQRLDAERKRLLEEGYRRAEERKRIERKRRKRNWLLVLVLFLILLIVALYFFTRN